jgi:hypothetical protein
MLASVQAQRASLVGKGPAQEGKRPSSGTYGPPTAPRPPWYPCPRGRSLLIPRPAVCMAALSSMLTPSSSSAGRARGCLYSAPPASHKSGSKMAQPSQAHFRCKNHILELDRAQRSIYDYLDLWQHAASSPYHRPWLAAPGAASTPTHRRVISQVQNLHQLHKPAPLKFS